MLTAAVDLAGMPRGVVIELALPNGWIGMGGNITSTELYGADEAFGAGSMGEWTPIVEVDGRHIVNRSQSNITTRLIHWFKDVHEKLSTPLANL